MDETQTMTVRLPVYIHERLRREAFDKRVSMNELVVGAVVEKFGILPPRTDPAARTRRPRRPVRGEDGQ